MNGIVPDRCELRATATRWVADEPQPGIVEVQFTDYSGHLVTIHEKSAVVCADLLLPTTRYPVEIRLQCEIVAVGTPSWAVRLLHAEDISGRTEFDVSWQSIDTGAADRPPRRRRIP